LTERKTGVKTPVFLVQKHKSNIIFNRTIEEDKMTETDEAFRQMMEGYGLTTAQIFYYRPEERHLLAEFVWQFYDIHPKFPRLWNFLEFWNTSIEGPINSVVIAHARLIRPSEWRVIDKEFLLH